MQYWAAPMHAMNPARRCRCYSAVKSFASGVFIPADTLRPGVTVYEELLEALTNTDVRTFFGPISFNHYRRNVGRLPVTMQLQNGVLVPVLPYDQAKEKVCICVQPALHVQQAAQCFQWHCWSFHGCVHRRGV